MNCEKNKGLKIAIILIGILAVLFIIGSIAISSIASRFSEAMDGDVSMYFDDYEVTSENLTSQDKNIESFNEK